MVRKRLEITAPLRGATMWALAAGVYSCLPLLIARLYVVEAIARWVEEPFGRGEDHLDLESICQAIDRSVTEVLVEGS